MHINLKRSISFLLLLATLISLVSVGSFAVEDPNAEIAENTDTIETDTTPEPEATAVPAETSEPEATPEPEPTAAPAEHEDGDPAAEGEGEETANDPAPLTSVAVKFYDYDGTTELASVSTQENGMLLAANIPQAGENAVSAWIYNGSSEGKEIYTFTTDPSSLTLTADTDFYAAYLVTYCDTDGSTVLKTEAVSKDGSPANAPTVTGDSKTITNWITSANKFVLLSEQKITADTSYTAWVSPGLNTSHTAYISGLTGTDSSGSKVSYFSPGGELTRAQAANMIYNLLDDKSMGNISVSFSDVPSGKWYATAVNTLASRGIITGYSDGTFKPNDSITRVQFVVILSRLFPMESGTCNFTDINPVHTSGNDWYYNAVATASAKGWISGYPSTKTEGAYYFAPSQTITRAEAVTILNRVLGRTPTESDKTTIDNLDYRIFIDVVSSKSTWAFYDIMEAATTDDSYTAPTSQLSEGYATVNGALCYVNENGTYAYKTTGLQKMPDGKYYYFTSNGISFKKRSAGIYSISGKLYIVNSDGSFVHDPSGSYDTRTYEYASHLYYINEDGSLLKNGYYGYLYFGENGAYTTGSKTYTYTDANGKSQSATLDAVVYSFLYNHGCLNSSLSQRERLRKAYLAIRDYPAECSRNGYNRFLNSSHSSSTYEDCAFEWFIRATGTCIEWCGAMVLVARRLGYDTYWEEGTLRNGASHAWEVVTIRGTKYLFDVEQEWGYLYKHYSTTSYKRDCYMMEYDPGNKIYYGTAYSSSLEENVWSPYKPY